MPFHLKSQTKENAKKPHTPLHQHRQKVIRKWKISPLKLFLASFPSPNFSTQKKLVSSSSIGNTHKKKALLNTLKNICGHYYGLFGVWFWFFICWVLFLRVVYYYDDYYYYYCCSFFFANIQ